MTRALRATWAILIWLFALMIPIQFYLAGHGAMESAHSVDNATIGMKTAWDPHAAFGTLMLVVSFLALLAVLAARPPRPLLALTGGLFITMVVQFVLPLLYDSVSTRWIAALHAVNALLVTGLALMLAVRSRGYLPFSSGRVVAAEDPALAGSRTG